MCVCVCVCVCGLNAYAALRHAVGIYLASHKQPRIGPGRWSSRRGILMVACSPSRRALRLPRPFFSEKAVLTMEQLKTAHDPPSEVAGWHHTKRLLYAGLGLGLTLSEKCSA